MNTFEIISVATLGVIVAETTYLAYQSRQTNQKRTNSDILVDTSVLMDGRIVPIAETGFLPGRLVVPRSVIGELQLLADNGDADKRERARRGLDVVKQLQMTEGVDITILQDGSVAREGVDERLLQHAKNSGGAIATIDFNLNKVAAVEGIRVLNVNELARNLRMTYLPGERLTIELTTTGSDNHQAVGHLGDGTMVVVEHAKKYIGNKVDIEIIRSLQTAAGRMMFARLASVGKAPAPHAENNKKPQQRSSQTQKSHATPTQKSVGKQPQQHAKQQHVNASKRSSSSKPQQKQAKATAPARRNAKTSSQREASFIKLINDQNK